MRVIDPVALPVSLVEFKRAVHVDAEADDLLIADLLAAAAEVVETAAGRAMAPRLVAFETPAGYWSRWYFPIAPVIDLVEASDASVLLQRGFDEPALQRAPAEGAVTLQARCGYADPDRIPRGLRQAVILIAREWYEAGFSSGEATPPPLSFGVQRLIRQARYRRPAEVV